MSRIKPITSVDDPRYARALAHPLRVRILAILDERVASPAQIAPDLDANLGVVAYHVRTLERLGLLKEAGTRQVRGATQHFYKAAERPTMSDPAWDDTPPAAKQAMVGATLQQINDYVSASAAAGGFDDAAAHITRRKVLLDEQGRVDVARALTDMVAKVEKIEAAAARRAARPNAQAPQTTGLVLMSFRGLTPGDPAADGAPKSRRRNGAT